METKYLDFVVGNLKDEDAVKDYLDDIISLKKMMNENNLEYLILIGLIANLMDICDQPGYIEENSIEVPVHVLTELCRQFYTNQTKKVYNEG